MGTRISFPRPDGKKAEGYLAKAAAAAAPGIVVIQEWWGLQDQIKGICDRLALAGYEALAPDLYSGVVVPYHDREAAGKEMNSLNFMDAVDQTVRGAAQYLKRSAPKIGLTGFCLGGAITTLGAARIPEISAAVAFYGIPPEGAVDPAKLSIPYQGHFSNNDDFFTPEAVRKLEAALKAAGKSPEIFFYDAGHAFMNEQREVHDREAADVAWSRMMKFWKKHLG
jgi:carboxymethylenebutenolidase